MNLLITGAWQETEKYIEAIEKMGHQVQFLQYEKDELPCEYEWVEGIIGNGIFLSHPIEQFTSLKYFLNMLAIASFRSELTYITLSSSVISIYESYSSFSFLPKY